VGKAMDVDSPDGLGTGEEAWGRRVLGAASAGGTLAGERPGCLRTSGVKSPAGSRSVKESQNTNSKAFLLW
jgi:hypothetical protein